MAPRRRRCSPPRDTNCPRQRGRGNPAKQPLRQEPEAEKEDTMPAEVRLRFITETLGWLSVCVFLAVSAFTFVQSAGFKADEWTVRKSGARLPLMEAHGPSVLERRAKMQLDYQTRLQQANARGRSRPMRRFLRWLHVPKTGTSFVNTMVRWGCPNIPPDVFIVPRKERPGQLDLPFEETFSWDWLFLNDSGRSWLREHCDGRLVTRHLTKREPHYSLYMHRPLTRWEIPYAVAMFRLPLQRIYSNYMHLSLHYNESRTPRESLLSFIQRPEFWSQQVKLLLGRHYRDKRPISNEEAKAAAKIVTEKLPFVGLTEEFELSSRLFHAKFGGVPHKAQFENVRPGIVRYRSERERSCSFRYNEAHFNGWTDAADDIVYETARKRFWGEVRLMKEEIELDGLGSVTVPSEHSQ